MGWQLTLLGFVVLMGIATVYDHLKRRLDQAAHERQTIMDAIAQIEAHVTWQSGYVDASEGQRRALYEAVNSQVAFRKFT